LRYRREQEYHQRPEVRKHQEWRQQQERQREHRGNGDGEHRGREGRK
jgi:hypothetical protein